LYSPEKKIHCKKQGGGLITEVKKKARRLDKTKGEMRRAFTLFLATIKASQIYLALPLNTYFSLCQTERAFNSTHTGQT